MLEGLVESTGTTVRSRTPTIERGSRPSSTATSWSRRQPEPARPPSSSRALSPCSPGIRRSLRRRVERDDPAGPIERLREAAWRLVEWRDFPTPWRREPFDRDAELMAVLDRLHRLAALSASPADPQDLFYLDVEPA